MILHGPWLRLQCTKHALIIDNNLERFSLTHHSHVFNGRGTVSGEKGAIAFLENIILQLI